MRIRIAVDGIIVLLSLAALAYVAYLGGRPPAWWVGLM